jgi:glycosyltransferase involved in cell wall biosynthesis
MRIAFVSSYPPTACGIATYTRSLIKAMRRLDPSLSITVLAETPWEGDSPPEGEVRPAFSFHDDYVEGLLEEVDRCMADVIHVQHEYGLFGIDQRFHELLAGLRERSGLTVVTMHSVHTSLSIDLGCAWWRGRAPMDDLEIEDYQREIVGLSDRTIVHQELPIRGVLLRQGCDPHRVVTIPHGTHVRPRPSRADSRRMLRFDPSPPLISAFGYFEPCKNLLVMLEALALVKKVIPDVRLWAGGHIRHPGQDVLEYRARCQQAIGRLGLEESVTIVDKPVPERQVPALFGATDVSCFVYDEDTRSSSGAAHTGLGFGVPLIASRIPKFSELAEVSDEILVDPKSADKIAGILIRLLQDDAFRHEIETSAQAFASRTSWEAVAAAHLALYGGGSPNWSMGELAASLRAEALTSA